MSSINTRLTNVQFVERALVIHDNKYDYSTCEYINAHTKINIICPIHGLFEQLPDNHCSKKMGCPKCAGNNRGNINDFISNSNTIHNNRYDYSLSIYKNNSTKLIVICNDHGQFTVSPNNHIFKKSGCPTCKKCNSLGRYDEQFFTRYPEQCDIPAVLYLISGSINGCDFLKIGITIGSINKRFYGHSKYNILPIYEKLLPLYTAFQLEQQILTKFKSYKCYPDISFKGFTECFIYDQVIIEYIKSHYLDNDATV